MYRYDEKPNTAFSESSSPLIPYIAQSEYAVLVGRNNCGKSYILKTLKAQIGQKACYLGPARYHNFNLLSSYSPTRNREASRKHREFLEQWQKQMQNLDNSPINLQQAIAELSDQQRDALREIIRLLLGTEMQIRQTVEDNSMSQKYISVGGHNLSFSSSGFRLITTLITSLFDTEFETFLIDEPELGISPEAQGILADFLFDREHRAKYFPHVKTLIFATHSTIFLDRKNIANNYMVSKQGDHIDVSRVSTQVDFNRIHFFLLGNRFETLYLPSLIVLVEGKSDHAFIQRALTLRFPNQRVSIINANSDSRMKEILSIARNLFSDIQRSPYRDRIIAVLDYIHGSSVKQSLETMGIPSENIVVWSQNGIEFVYPPELVDQIYGAGSALEINDDRVSRNGLSYTKADLAEKIVETLTASTKMHEEFDQFLSLVKARVA